jgi:hypothetical protein
MHSVEDIMEQEREREKTLQHRNKRTKTLHTNKDATNKQASKQTNKQTKAHLKKLHFHLAHSAPHVPAMHGSVYA